MTRALVLPLRAFVAFLVIFCCLAPQAVVRAESDDSPPQARPKPAGAAGSGSTAPIAALLPAGFPSAAEDTPVDVVCKAAVAMALAEPERARGFLTRARLAGWLPELRFRIYRRLARTEGLSFNDVGTSTVIPVDISAIDDVRYEWRATWDLSRMVFNPDELQAHFEALRMSDVRRDIQSLVIRLYFERRRLLADTRPDSTGIAETAGPERRFLRIAEIEAQLDALSDGAFSAGAPTRRQTAPIP